MVVLYYYFNFLVLNQVIRIGSSYVNIRFIKHNLSQR